MSAALTAFARLGFVVRERIALAAPSRRLRLTIVEQVLEAPADGRSLRVLDAGCGDGLLALALAKRHPDWELLGVDLREELLRGARARGRSRRLGNVRFERADLTQALPEGAFDVVLAIECLEEIEDDQAALRAMAAALAPGGTLVAHVPERSWRGILPGSPSTWRDQVRQGYSADEFCFALVGVGLEMVSVRATFRGTAVVAQELADRIKRAPLFLRTLVFPVMVAAVALERRGLTWGRGHALLAVARRPLHHT